MNTLLASETFWDLLKSPGHWYFEVFLMVLFDFVIGYVVWQRLIKPHIHRDVEHAGHGHEVDEEHVAGPSQVADVFRIQDLEDAIKVASYELEKFGDVDNALKVLNEAKEAKK